MHLYDGSGSAFISWKCQALLQDILLINILVLWALGRLCLKLIQFHFFKGGRFFITFCVCCNTNSYFWKGGKEKLSFCERLFPGVSVHKVLKNCLRPCRAEGNNCFIDSQKAQKSVGRTPITICGAFLLGYLLTITNLDNTEFQKLTL